MSKMQRGSSVVSYVDSLTTAASAVEITRSMQQPQGISVAWDMGKVDKKQQRVDLMLHLQSRGLVKTENVVLPNCFPNLQQYRQHKIENKVLRLKKKQ